jgi:hypothetical protein
MLINDSATVAIEQLVYLHPKELTRTRKKFLGLGFQNTLTGHIYILQVRFNKIHILDYKPDANKTDKRAVVGILTHPNPNQAHEHSARKPHLCLFRREKLLPV